MVLYNLVVRFYALIIHIAALRKPKAAQWVNGRRDWRKQLENGIKPLKNSKIIWVHCASYGEFEQGRPLIEAIKSSHSNYRILLTFFSPSGYEAFKNWPGADFICYLPLDTKKNAGDFLDIVQPAHTIFIKYEFWVNFLFALKKRNIPTYLVSAVFKPHHPFFKWYGGLFRRSLQSFTKLFIQDTESARLLNQIGIRNYEITGDTRFDRVLEIKKGNTGNAVIENFKAGNKIIMAGSTWPGDDEMVLAAFKKLSDGKVKLIIAPHEVDEKSIEGLVKKLKQLDLNYGLYTENVGEGLQVLVINTIGLLSKSYVYADCAYVGGGFNGGLHNILEPAVFQIPVCFYGDKYKKFNEAVQLLDLGSANKVNGAEELETVFRKQLFDDDFRLETFKQLAAYFEKNGNVSGKIVEAIFLNEKPLRH